jgi:hypothetical protein
MSLTLYLMNPVGKKALRYWSLLRMSWSNR